MMEMTTDKTTLLRGRPIVFGVAGGTASGKTTVMWVASLFLFTRRG